LARWIACLGGRFQGVSPKRTPLGHYFQYVKRDGSLPKRDVSYMIASQHIEW
jgi:hypothetical protein